MLVDVLVSEVVLVEVVVRAIGATVVVFVLSVVDPKVERTMGELVVVVWRTGPVVAGVGSDAVESSATSLPVHAAAVTAIPNASATRPAIGPR